MADMQDGKFVHNKTVPPEGNRVLPLFSLKGKTAIVSGATSGIGLAVAQAFAEAGADVAIWYNKRKDEAEQSAREIEEEYGVKCRRTPISHLEKSKTKKETLIPRGRGGEKQAKPTKST